MPVCLSHACSVTKPNNALRMFWYDTKRQSLLVFWHQQWLVGDAPFRVKFALKMTHPFEKRRLWQISVYNVSSSQPREMAKKFSYDEKDHGFPTSYIDGVHGYTLPLSLPKSSLKSDFFVFLAKIHSQSNKVCYTVSLCENVHRQSCSIAIPPSKGPQILAQNVTLQPKIYP